MTARVVDPRGIHVVLIHGATSSSHAWDDVLPVLERKFPVLAPTLAGHRGGPPLPKGPTGVVHRIVDVMCEQLDAVGVGTAHLVGNSLGGWVALELARRGRARSVLALSPAGAWRSSRDLTRLLAVFRSAAAMGRVDDVLDIGTHKRARRMLLRLMAEHADRMTPVQVATMLADIDGCTALPDILKGARQNGPLKPMLDHACRIRIAWGTSDRLLPFMRYGAPMFAAVEGAEFKPLDGVGHVPMIDDPKCVANLVLDYVAKIDAAGVDRQT